MSGGTKSFLYAWCGKRKVTPSYDVRTSGSKIRPTFLCKVTVPGFDYVGEGNSTKKKEAQRNAANDFLLFLMRDGKISLSEVPGELPAEDLNINSGIDGNWTLDNAKTKLHQFLQINKQKKPDYEYSEVGPDHNRSFVCKLTVFVKQLGRNIYAKEHGSNKQMASKSCALSIVRQLYHLKVIEAYSDVTKKKQTYKLEPYDVSVDPQLIEDIESVLTELDIHPVVVPEDFQGPEPMSLILEKNIEVDTETRPHQAFLQKNIEVDTETCPHQAGVVSWSPPQPNWNPWISCNIDEGPLATMSVSAISEGLQKEYNERLENDVSLQKMLEVRQELPVYKFRDSILEAIRENSAVIICGAAGCGKSTQVPQYILDYYLSRGCGADCCIVVTQPQRISAVSVAERIVEERAEALGNSTGYSVRFESCLPRPYGSVLFCTVGVLLHNLEAGLRGVSHVIVDEIHERDVNTDFIMVVLRDMVRAFPHLRVILMSATIDTSLFQEYFGNCPIIEVSGCTFPVQDYFLEDCIQMTSFVPPTSNKKRKRDDVSDTEEPDENMNKVIGEDCTPSTKQSMAALSESDLCFELIEALLLYIKNLNVPGAVLVFLPGWKIIFAFMRHLQQHPIFGASQYCILPLHSQVPREDRHKVFEPVPTGVTKIILATNIAETSITINDVVFVIDSCKVKMKLFTSRNKMAIYPTVWASKTNLEQRKGRAGLVRAGFAFRLCSRARFEKLENYTKPEIFRTPLHEIALAIKLLRLGDIGKFLSKALEPPPIDAVIESEVLLREIGALDHCNELTPLGKMLARLPVEPRLGKMLVLACVFSCGDPLCTIAAHSSTFPEPFDTSFPEKLAYVHRKFCGSRWSDHLTMLNAFVQWEDAHMQGEFVEQSFCEQFSWSLPTLRITHNARNQLKDLLIMVGFPKSCLASQSYHFEGPDSKLDIVVALLTMKFYPNVCFHHEKRRLTTTKGRMALIHKLSVNCSKLPPKFPSPFFVFGEKIYSKTAACKQMTMITPLHLLLFGCRKVEYINGCVIVDKWINLKMPARNAAAIVAMQPVIEDLIIQAALNPESVAEPIPINLKIIDIIKRLCDVNAAKFGLSDSEETFDKEIFSGGEPPRKAPRLSSGMAQQ